MAVHVIDLSGSLIEPNSKADNYLHDLRTTVLAALDDLDGDKAIIVTGGGELARKYQSSYCDLVKNPGADAQDWIGIAATRLHGELLRHLFAPDCIAPLIIDPTAVDDFPGRVMIAAGWKPGFSTDYDAVLLAERFKSNTVIKLSNVMTIYSGDPKLDPDARPLSRLTWGQLGQMNKSKWQPGTHLPFDPVATKAADQQGLTVIFTGSDTANLRATMDGRPYIGTTISPT